MYTGSSTEAGVTMNFLLFFVFTVPGEGVTTLDILLLKPRLFEIVDLRFCEKSCGYRCKSSLPITVDLL